MAERLTDNRLATINLKGISIRIANNNFTAKSPIPKVTQGISVP